ncbi:MULTISPECIES: KGK domain-containing protein [Spirulina sp. CCY15215]|uniref:KGK domain-containing protein n=1 Tax=Spirulina sp. CCY15215 TaxID=2767591 RepID=UPI00194FA04A
MDNKFEPLDRGEVLSVEESVQILIGHSTFRVDELAKALKTQLLEHKIGGLTEEKAGWFNAEGAECQVLRYSAGNWQRGKVRISFEFCPNDSDEFIPPQTATVSTPKTTVAREPISFKEEPTPTPESLPEEAIAEDEAEDFLESVDLPLGESGDLEEEAIEEQEDFLPRTEELIMDELAGVEEEDDSSLLADETDDIWAEKEELSELAGSSLVEAETEKLWLEEEEGEDISQAQLEEESEEIDTDGGLIENIFDDAPDDSLLEAESEEIDTNGGLIENIFDDAPDDSLLEAESEEIDTDGGLIENIFDDAPDDSLLEAETAGLGVDEELVEDIFDDAPGDSLLEEETAGLGVDEELVEDIFDEDEDDSLFEKESAELDVDEELVEDIFDEDEDDSLFEKESAELDVDEELVEDIFDEDPSLSEVEEEPDIFAETSGKTPTTDVIDAELEFAEDDEDDIFAESLSTPVSQPEVDDAPDSIFDTSALEEEELSLSEEVFANGLDEELDLEDAFGSGDAIDLSTPDKGEETNKELELSFDDEDEDELFSSIDDDLDWGTSDDDELALGNSSESNNSGAENEEEEAVFADIWQDIDEFS